jgi:hypothetical protein
MDGLDRSVAFSEGGVDYIARVDAGVYYCRDASGTLKACESLHVTLEGGGRVFRHVDEFRTVAITEGGFRSGRYIPAQFSDATEVARMAVEAIISGLLSKGIQWNEWTPFRKSLAAGGDGAGLQR